jgi:hypothetical protein
MKTKPLSLNEAGSPPFLHDHADHDHADATVGHAHPPPAPGSRHGYIPVPDWFSWENQGAGIAVTSLERNGRNDLLVLMVDAAAGQNRGLYRVGKALDAEGNVTGGWSAWIEIPDWFPWENQGAGLAVTSLAAGRLDLVVFMIDNPPGKNQGYYRIGKGLDGAGNVTAGWTPWREVPDWFSWENQHGGIALADLDGDGRQELTVFMIDNPPEGNRGLFRVGRALDGEGNVTGGWSEWTDVPDWFSWENQGGGVAIADLGGGGSDLIVFQVDAPPQQNQGFFRIGRGLRADGKVHGGWEPWHGLPDWFAWENQGAAITAADARGTGQPQLAALMVDNPPGQNAGLYRLIDIIDAPAARGRWQLLPYHSEVLAVHGALLRTGKVLFFAGSGSSKVRFLDPDFGDTDKKFWCSVAWDPDAEPTPGTRDNFTHPATLRDPTGRPFDFFCGGDAFLPDGSMLSAGGTLNYPGGGKGFQGRKDAALFDPATEEWRDVGDMAGGRWYPTLITLGDGRVLAASGLTEHGGLNHGIEVYDAATDSWQALPVPPHGQFPGLPLYAHLFLLEDGRLFFTGGRSDDPSQVGPCFLDLTTSPVHITGVAGLRDPASRNQSASVLLPPAQDQRVMVIGGGPMSQLDAIDRVDIIDLKSAHPAFRAAAPMALPRMHSNAVLLPDRTVFVSGGSLQRESEIRARLQAEIYDPATDRWHIAATATVTRKYHSIALLLPDGRVVAAGGNPEGGHQVEWEPPDPNEELRLEVFSPPYLFRGPRPAITGAPDDWSHGARIDVGTDRPADIKWASLISPSVTTHSFNNTQRLVDLPILSRGPNRLKVEVTQNANLAPPGWYMLFLTDGEGIPSVARWIRLS